MSTEDLPLDAVFWSEYKRVRAKLSLRDCAILDVCVGCLRTLEEEATIRESLTSEELLDFLGSSRNYLHERIQKGIENAGQS